MLMKLLNRHKKDKCIGWSQMNLWMIFSRGLDDIPY